MKLKYQVLYDQFEEKDNDHLLIVLAEKIKNDPHSYELNYLLGLCHFFNHHLRKAKLQFKKCIKLHPFRVESYDNLIRIYSIENKLNNVIRIQKKLIQRGFITTEKLFLLGANFLRTGNYKKAIYWLDNALNSCEKPDSERMLPYGEVSLPRLVHDIKQIRYLIDREILPRCFEATLNSYDSLITDYYNEINTEDHSWTKHPTRKVDYVDLDNIYNFYRRFVHLRNIDLNKVDDVLHPKHDFVTLEKKFNDSPIEYLVVDDFLSPKALSEFYEFFVESTVWHNDNQKGKNYLGAYQMSGAWTPLVDRLDRELKLAFPQILKNLELNQIWAYKHVLGNNAIGVHADFSKINVNIWLTPDSANNDPDSGGLIIYDAKAPENLEFDDFNGNELLIKNLTEGARRDKVVYKENRATIFNSKLFHASDKIDFKKNYRDLRINLTLLYQ